MGNGWEWTTSILAPLGVEYNEWKNMSISEREIAFQKQSSYPEYTSDFFDGKHFVIKGASPFTNRKIIRSTFRNVPDFRQKHYKNNTKTLQKHFKKKKYFFIVRKTQARNEYDKTIQETEVM